MMTMNETAKAQGHIAPLMNVSLLAGAVRRAMERNPELPGIVCFSGWSGLGKSFAACFSANKYRAYHVACQSSWTRKALLLAILKEMGIAPAKTLYDMADQISEQLALSKRPLIIDEVDHILDKGNMLEIIRDLYEGSNGVIVLIGEENAPSKIRAQSERFHNRVLEWVLAQPASREDAAHLARIYAAGLDIDAEVLDLLVEKVKGVARRVSVNLDKLHRDAAAAGMMHVTLADMKEFKFYTGDAPSRRG